MIYFLKATAVSMLVLVVGLGAFSYPSQTQAQAVVPVLDKPNLIVNTGTAKSTFALETKEEILDAIVNTLGKNLIKSLSTSIINWINSGFEGGPTFVTNPSGFLLDTANEIAGNFIARSELGFLCDPFEIEVRRALAINYGLRVGADGFTKRISCTLSDVITNTENAVGGGVASARENTWDAWYNKTQKPGGNAYDAYFESETELGLRIASAQGEEILKWNWGSGFQSITDEFGNILTPGATIEAQLSEVLGSDLRQLELADEINEIVGALAGQLIMQVTNGINGLAGASSKDRGNYGIGTAYENNPPRLEILGPSLVTIFEGDVYIDQGARAFDIEDGDITNEIVTNNTVDSMIPGTYFVTYFVDDSEGETAIKTRTVVVQSFNAQNQ